MIYSVSTNNNENNDNNNRVINDNQQARLDAALDMALDELDSDDDEEQENETFSDCLQMNDDDVENQNKTNNEHKGISNVKNARTTSPSTSTRTAKIAETTKVESRQPTNPQNDEQQLFATMMQQFMTIMEQGDNGNNDTYNGRVPPAGTASTKGNDNADRVEEMLSKLNDHPEAFLEQFMQDIQQQVALELAKNSSPSTTNIKSTKQQEQETTKKNVSTVSSTSPKKKSENTTTTASPAKTTTTTASSTANTTTPTAATPTTSKDVESVLLNLVNELSQTMQKKNDDDDDDDDISELDDDELPPDMDDLFSNKNFNNNVGGGENEIIVLQQLMNSLMTNLNDNNDKDKAISGDGNDPTTMIDTMMESLLCKDIMYEPIKCMTNQFPTWLQDHKTILSPTEYERRNQQYKLFQQIVSIYEVEPINMSQLIVLMQKVQEYGSPPNDLIQNIVPNIELDENGIPKMGTTSTGTLPFPNSNEECLIM